ncbi:MAG: hypothetical protein R2780_01715 [Crocinitomicaceae bacterium]
MIERVYYTCDELMGRHPDAILWGWDSKKIGVFYRCLLIHGRRFGKNKRLAVDENSFVTLMEFVYNNRLADFMVKDDPNDLFMGYEEVMAHFPQAELYRWNPTVMGILCSSQLLYGKKCFGEAGNLVSVRSAGRLIDFTADRFQKIAALRKRAS